MSCISSFKAEVCALEWASDYADSCGWKNVLWEVDAMEVVNEVLAVEDPTGWFSFSSILAIRSRFCVSGWVLNWISSDSTGS